MPARAPDQHRATITGAGPDNARDRIVGARLDRAIVDQQKVGDVRQSLARVAVLVGDRLVGDVAAGHHDGVDAVRMSGEVREQQVVHRRVGEHDPELGCARRDRVRHSRRGEPRREDDRACVRAQQLGLREPELDEPRGRPHRADHQREGLVLAVLARAQPRDDMLVVGAARQVIAAKPLDGHDCALPDCGGRGADRIRCGVSIVRAS